MSTTLAHISVNLSTSIVPRDHQFWEKPRSSRSLTRSKLAPLHRNGFEPNWVLRVAARSGRDGVFWVRDERLKTKKRVVLVRGYGGGGGGGGDRDVNGRLLANIGLALGLTYLSVTGQIGLVFDAIGWVVDTVISISLFAVLVPILGLGAFFWWAGRGMVRGTCPNCGNNFQVLKSTLNNEVQLCPYCTQPFSVKEDRFVRDPVMFSNESPFGEKFNDFPPRSNKGMRPSAGVVDVEAEVTDAD